MEGEVPTGVGVVDKQSLKRMGQRNVTPWVEVEGQEGLGSRRKEQGEAGRKLIESGGREGISGVGRTVGRAERGEGRGGERAAGGEGGGGVEGGLGSRGDARGGKQ